MGVVAFTFKSIGSLFRGCLLFATLASLPLYANAQVTRSPTPRPGRTNAAQCPKLPWRFVALPDSLPAPPSGFDALALYDAAKQRTLLNLPLKSGTWTVTPEDHERVRDLKADDSLERPQMFLAWTRAADPSLPPCLQSFDIARTAVGAVLCPDLDN